MPNSKLYLLWDSHRKKYVVFDCENNTHIKLNPWLFRPMLLVPLSFPKSGTTFKPPQEQLTACPDEAQVIKPKSKRPPIAVLFRDPYGDAYVCGFGLNDAVTKSIKREARSLKINSVSVDVAKKKLRALLVRQYPKQLFPKKLQLYLLDDYVSILKQLKRGELPTSYVKYFTDASSHFSNHELTETDIAERVASLFVNVKASLIIECEQKTDYNLKCAGVSGVSVHEKVKAISDALKALALDYQHRHPVDSLTEVKIIVECHTLQTILRKIKHKKEKQPSTLRIPKEKSTEFDRVIDEELLSRPKMPESSFSRLVSHSSNFQMDDKLQETKIKQNKIDVERFYREKLHILNTYQPLLPFWFFKDDMFGHVKNFDHWVYLLLQDNRAFVWLRFFIAGFAAAKIQAPDKEPRVVDAIVTSVQLEPVMDLLNDIKENYIGDRAVKARFFQALLPLQLKHLFNLRNATMSCLNIISKADFDDRQDIIRESSASANVLNHVVDFIRTGEGMLDYRVRISHGKKRGTGGGKDIDISGEDLRQYPGLVEVLHETFKVYHILTGHKVEHDNHEPRCRILAIKPSLGPCKGMNRVVRHHEMPWPFPNLEHGSKYFISPSIDIAGRISTSILAM